MLYVFVHSQFEKSMFGEHVLISAVDLSVLIYQGNNELIGFKKWQYS